MIYIYIYLYMYVLWIRDRDSVADSRSRRNCDHVRRRSWSRQNRIRRGSRLCPPWIHNWDSTADRPRRNEILACWYWSCIGMIKILCFKQHGSAFQILLKRFKMTNCELISTPVDCRCKLFNFDEGKLIDPIVYKSLATFLRYLICTRPVILYVDLMSQLLEKPKAIH